MANTNLIIFSSVGHGVSNRPVDARVVQTMMNFIAPPLGGPSTALRVDGIAGVKTVSAIGVSIYGAIMSEA